MCKVAPSSFICPAAILISSEVFIRQCTLNLHLFHSRKLAVIILFLPEIFTILCMSLYSLKYGGKYSIDGRQNCLTTVVLPCCCCKQMWRIFPKRRILKDPSLDVLLGIGNRYLNIIHFRSKVLRPIKISALVKYLLFVLKCAFLLEQLLLHLQRKCAAPRCAGARGSPGGQYFNWI